MAHRTRQRHFIIYGLCDPTTKELRYIGGSINGISRAIQLHKGSTHCYNWQRRVRRSGLIEEAFIVEEFQDADSMWEAEGFYINYFRSIGCDLTNIREGGLGRGGGWNKKNGEYRNCLTCGKQFFVEKPSMKKRVCSKSCRRTSPETKELMSASLTGHKNWTKPWTEERRKRQVEGYKISEATRQKLSEAAKRNKLSERGLKARYGT